MLKRMSIKKIIVSSTAILLLLIIYLIPDNRKDIELKNRIRNSSYDLLELAYKANVTTNNNYRKNLLEELIAKIKVIDFLLNICYEKQIINSKRYVKFGEKMDDILKYTLGWIKTT